MLIIPLDYRQTLLRDVLLLRHQWWYFLALPGHLHTKCTPGCDGLKDVLKRGRQEVQFISLVHTLDARMGLVPIAFIAVLEMLHSRSHPQPGPCLAPPSVHYSFVQEHCQRH